MKLYEVYGRLNALLKLGEKCLPVKISYAIAKNIKVLAEEYKTIDAQRIELCKKYAEKDGDGNPVKKEKDGELVYDLTEENNIEMNKEYNELLNVDSDLVIHKVSIADFEKCDSNSRYDILTPSEYTTLEFMIE